MRAVSRIVGVRHPGTRRPAGVPANFDSVRGVACLLVIALHIVGDGPESGFHLPMTSPWHYAISSLDFLRMPLFTALSGYLYAGDRARRDALGRFCLKKLRRIGLPLLSATVLIWAMRRTMHVDPTPLRDALLFGYEHLWYLQSLLILFTLMALWDVWSRPGLVALVLTGLAASMVAQSFPVTTFLSLNGVFYLAPYFLFGILLRDRAEWLHDPGAGLAALGIAAIVLTTQQLSMNGLANEINAMQVPAALCGMAGVVLFLRWIPCNSLLATIGGYSYSIYLWHMSTIAAARVGLMRIGIEGTGPLFVLSLVAAVVVPVAIYQTARRVPVVCVMLTGESAPARARLRWSPQGPRTRFASARPAHSRPDLT